MAWLMGWVSHFVWPSSAAALKCVPDDVFLNRKGVAQCDGPRDGDVSLHSAQRLALRGKIELNRASAEDLILIDGIGPSLAKAILASKPRGGFESWEQLDAVPGIGPSKLKALQKFVDIR